MAEESERVSSDGPKKQAVGGPSPIAGGPLLYCDQVGNIQFGAYTSKLFLTLEPLAPDTPFASAGVVVMPTAMLVGLAQRVLAEVGTDGFRKFNKSRAGELQSALDAIAGDSSGPKPKASKT